MSSSKRGKLFMKLVDFGAKPIVKADPTTNARSLLMLALI